MLDGNKVLFSGMQATGNLTLGNYLGALKNWVTLCDKTGPCGIAKTGKKSSHTLYCGGD